MENTMMVSVDMITYKHEDFIAQAIEGVLMQETNFEYELIIADDCSPNGTESIVREIIANHPKGNQIKYFRHDKNIGMIANGIFAVQQCKGKYIAICEGDDYWTDPLKLQKQVDFLEANPEFMLCTHNYSVLNQTNGVLNNKIKFESNIEYDLNIYFDDHYTPTLTSCWRNIFTDYTILKQGKYFSDFFLFHEILKHGKGYFMVDNMATYRVHDQGVCSSLSENQKILNHILMLEDLYLNNKYNIEIKRNLARYNLAYFVYCLRIEKNKIPKTKYLINFLKNDPSIKSKIFTLFVKLPYYLTRYWLRNLVSL